VPPKSKTIAKTKPKTRTTIVPVPTPDAPAGSVAGDVEFEFCGETYTAHMPKDFIYLQLGAAWAPGASAMTKAQAIALFIRACLNERDRDRIEERFITSRTEDPARGMELLVEINKLAAIWEPFIKAEFDTANLRATAAAAV
jgi:hypothetical protein